MDPSVRARLPRPLLAAALAMSLLVAGCAHPSSPAVTPGSATPAQQAVANGTVTDKPLPASVLDLPLRDPSGRTVTLGSLHGKTVVLTDFLTTCQEVCPMTSVNFRDVADAAGRAGLATSVQLVEVTVDLNTTGIGGVRQITRDEALLSITRICDYIARSPWPPV